MTYEMLVAVNVVDDAGYRAYRDAMRPILESMGGGFGYDFKISEVLISRTDNEMNRVFTIYFPSEEVKERFFADPAYVEAKKTHFESAVNATTVLASYER